MPSHEVYKKEDYLKILDKYDNVISIVAGHTHINYEAMRNGVYHISSPSLLNNEHEYKVISISTTKGFSPMVYTELKEVEIPKK
jgi:predicted phosphodiesterase